MDYSTFILDLMNQGLGEEEIERYCIQNEDGDTSFNVEEFK
jgi:hypothetical protein